MPATTVSFGRRQIDQMLADRPDMAGVLRDDDPVLIWITEGMNGDRFGQRIYWNADSPRGGQPAEHAPPWYGYPPFIRLSGGTETTAVDKWGSLVFELFNLENTSEFHELFDKATAGEIDGDAYATACLKLEFAAIKKCAKYFQQHPLPYSKHSNDPWYKWVHELPDSFEYNEYVESLNQSQAGYDFNPLKFYKDYFDTAIAPYLRDKQRNGD